MRPGRSGRAHCERHRQGPIEIARDIGHGNTLTKGQDSGSCKVRAADNDDVARRPLPSLGHREAIDLGRPRQDEVRVERVDPIHYRQSCRVRRRRGTIEVLRRAAWRDRLREVPAKECDAVEPILVRQAPNPVDEATGGHVEDPDAGALERRNAVALEDEARNGPLARGEAERAHAGLIERDNSSGHCDRVGGFAGCFAVPPLGREP